MLSFSKDKAKERHREKHQVSYSRGDIVWHSSAVMHCPVPFHGNVLHVGEVKSGYELNYGGDPGKRNKPRKRIRNLGGRRWRPLVSPAISNDFYCIYSENFRQCTLQIEFYMRYIFTCEKSGLRIAFFTCQKYNQSPFKIESLSQSELSTLMACEKRGLEISVRLKFVSR